MISQKYIIVFIMICIYQCLAYTQEQRELKIFIGYDYYSFFHSSTYDQYFANNHIGIPSISFEKQLNNDLLNNITFAYLYHLSDNNYILPSQDSDPRANLPIGFTNAHGEQKEYLVFDKIKYSFYQSDNFCFQLGIGPMIGYVIENYYSSSLTYSYVYDGYSMVAEGFTSSSGRQDKTFIVGAIGGVTIDYHIGNSPFGLYMDCSLHYARPLESSLLPEYTSYIISGGINFIL
jgi:hypothetical protein